MMSVLMMVFEHILRMVDLCTHNDQRCVARERITSSVRNRCFNLVQCKQTEMFCMTSPQVTLGWTRANIYCPHASTGSCCCCSRFTLLPCHIRTSIFYLFFRPRQHVEVETEIEIFENKLQQPRPLLKKKCQG